MLGIEPALGRTFTPADAAAVGLESSVILTQGVWQSHYGGDPNIIGRAVILNDRPQTLVGVMPLGRSSHRVQRALAVGQVALCLALLVAAHLMIRSFLSLQRANLGFDERPLLSLRVFATGDAFDPIPARAALFARALDSLRALPGVAAVAATSAVPGDDGGAMIRVTNDGAAGPFVGAQSITVTPGLFDTLAVRLEQGRTFTENEFANPDSDAVVIPEMVLSVNAECFWYRYGVMTKVGT